MKYIAKVVKKVQKIKLSLAKIISFLKETDIKLTYFIIPTLLSISAAVFEGISLGLLLPLAKGAIYGDFAFFRKLPIIKNIISIFPGKLINTDSFIFGFLIILIFFAVLAKNALQYFSF